MADDLSDIDAAFGAPTRSSGSAPVDDMSDIDAAFGNVTPWNGPSSTFSSIAEAPFVGFNRGVASALDMPAKAGNLATSGVLSPNDTAARSYAAEGGVDLGPDDYQNPTPVRPFDEKVGEKALGSISRPFEYFGVDPSVSPNPDLHPARSTFERILQGAGEGAAGVMVPELAAGAILPKLAPKAAEIVGNTFGASKTAPAALGNATVGAVTGGTGEAAGQLADAVLPDSPWAQFGARVLGSLAGGAGAAATGAGIRAAANAGQKSYNSLMPTEALRQRAAGQVLRDEAHDPGEILNQIEDVPRELVPGSKPTTFQLTGDMGLGSFERDVQTASPDLFNARRADQNAARVGQMQQVQPTGAPEDVSAFFRSRLQDIDDRAGKMLDQGTQEAKDQAAAIGSGQPPEAIGYGLRDKLQNSREAAKQQEDALWKAVDPSGTLAVPMSSIKRAAQDIYGALPQAASANLGSTETTFRDLALGYKPVEPFGELQSLRSELAGAMRQELSTNGKTPAYGRMSGLMDSVQGVINNTIEHKAAQDAHAVSLGQMAPEDTMEARLARSIQNKVDAFYAERSARASSDTEGNGAGPGGGQGATSRVSGAGSKAGWGSGRDAGAEGISTPPLSPNFDQGAADRLSEATAATKARAQTYDTGPVGDVLKNQGSAGLYKMPDSGVPAAMISKGPGGYDRATAYQNAVKGDPESMQLFHDAVAENLRQNAMTPDGMIDPKKFATWQKNYGDLLRTLPPELRDRFSNAANATQAVGDAAALRKQALDTYQKGIIGKVMKLDNSTDVMHTVGNIFQATDSVAQMRRLAQEAARNPDAQQGLRKAIADYMMENFVGNRDAGNTGTKQMSGDAFQTFLRKNRPVLEQAFDSKAVDGMNLIAHDIARSNRSIDTKIPGQSNTAQDIIKYLKSGDHQKPSLFQVLNVRDAGIALFTGHPAAAAGILAGGIGKAIAGPLRDAGIRRVSELVRDAMLDPDLAKTLIMKASPAEHVGSHITLRHQLSRLGVYGPLSPMMGPVNSDQSQSAPPLMVHRATGGRVEADPNPSEAQKQVGNYRKGHMRVHGLDVTIENPKGSFRSGTDHDGKPWRVRLQNHYGYIRGTIGADGDHVDAYVGPDENSDKVFVIDQKHIGTNKFDEHKVMLGFKNREAALGGYNSGFSDGKGHTRMMKITPMSIPELKEWLASGRTHQPLSERTRAYAAH